MLRYLLCLILFLVGCTVGPKYKTPILDTPCEWHSPLAEGMDTEPLDCFLWWKSLQDPTLDSLIERAINQNLDLYIAASRILEARAEQKGGVAALLPHIDGTANYGHVKYSRKTLNRILGTSLKRNHIDFFEAGFDAEWEIDLFGMQAHEINALKAQAEAAEEEFCHIWVTLLAEVGRNYIELRGLQSRQQLLNENIEAQKESLSLNKALTHTGFSSILSERQTEELLNEFAAENSLIQLSIVKTIHRLSILLGYSPGQLYEELKDLQPLPSIPLEKPIGIPSELLRRRPDVRKAERELAAATERIGVAVAALYPRLSLRGFIGEIGSFCSGGAFSWLAGPSCLLPIFNSKALEQDVTLNKIRTQQAFYEYQKTLLNALEEVENAIASFQLELEHNQYLTNAKTASQAAHDLSFELYQKGFKDYIEVIESNRKLMVAEDIQAQSQIALLLNYISLYKALGGGWDITLNSQ